MRKGQKKGVYNVIHHYFKTWSHDMAYVLGFLVADGNIQRRGYYVKVEVKPEDRALLEFICDQISPGYELRQSRPSELRWYPASAIIKTDLAKLGVVPCKTGQEIVPPNLPDAYLWDFIRGLFDGDGTVGDCHVAITSNSKSILDDLSNRVGMGYVTRQRMNWNWVVERKDELTEYHNKLYVTGTYCLARKRSLFDYLVSSQQRGKHRPFTLPEDDYIRGNYRSQTRFELAMALGRSGTSIKNRLKKLGIKKGG